MNNFNFSEVHDYTLYKENGDIFATISCRPEQLYFFVVEVWKSRKSIYNFLELDLPKKIIVHKTWSTEDFICEISDDSLNGIKYKYVWQLSREEKDELKQNYFHSEDNDGYLSWEIITDAEIENIYAKELFVHDDFFCNMED